MAIARNSTSQGGLNDGYNLTYTHTIAGSDTLLIVEVQRNDDSTISGVTFNGTAMTKLAETGTSRRTETWGLLNPAIGTHNIVVSGSPSEYSVWSMAVSYTGVLQSALPSEITSNTATAGSPFSLDLTSSVDGCWSYMGSSSQATTTSSDTLVAGLGDGRKVADSNGSIGNSGTNKVMSLTFTGTPVTSANMLLIKPSIASGPANLKTILGLPTASAKTVNGLAIASVKTINGLS